MRTNTVYLNGVFGPASEAKVSVFDRGFLFGDGVYEVIPFYDGRAFGWEGHMQRLARSLAAIGIPNPHTDNEWRTITKTLLAANGPTQLVYFQITRGDSNPRKHTFDDTLTPTVFANCFPFTPVAIEGIAAITFPDDRWEHCHIKSLNLLPNVLAMQAAKNQGAIEAILIHNGFVTEGSASNVFVIKHNEVFTTPTDGSILPGVTRNIIIRLLADIGFAVKEVPLSTKTLMQADEIWVSSVGKEMTPVTTLDRKPVGTGKPGPVWQRAYPAYQRCIHDDATPL